MYKTRWYIYFPMGFLSNIYNNLSLLSIKDELRKIRESLVCVHYAYLPFLYTYTGRSGSTFLMFILTDGDHPRYHKNTYTSSTCEIINLRPTDQTSGSAAGNIYKYSCAQILDRPYASWRLHILVPFLLFRYVTDLDTWYEEGLYQLGKPLQYHSYICQLCVRTECALYCNLVPLTFHGIRDANITGPARLPDTRDMTLGYSTDTEPFYA